METLLNFTEAKKLNRNSDDSFKGSSLFKVVFGIMREWELTQEELATILNKPPSTISEWKKNKFIPFSKRPTNDEYQIIQFIEFYKLLSDFFASIEDRTSWIRDKNKALGEASPFEFIKVNPPRNLALLNDLIRRLANP